MTVSRLLAGAQRLLVGVVLVMSGAYLLIYLYRWEWNRAIVSGLFFLAAEVALASSMLLRRLRALEQAAPAAPTPRQRLRETPVERPNPFDWLSPRRGRVGVFVPVLLGAGAILSALAYVVERVAEVSAVPLVDRRLASRLAVLAPPVRPGTAPALPSTPRRAGPATIAAALVGMAGIGVVVWLGISALVDATQSRPDPAKRPAQTAIELSVSHREGPDRYLAAAEALWEGCRSSLGSVPASGRVVDRGDGRVSLVVEPGIGRLRARRLTGCLTDLKVDYVLARVLSIESTP